MFQLKTPPFSEEKTEANALEMKGEYPKLEEAIAAAKTDHLDLRIAVIEKDDCHYSVIDWIKIRIAGGFQRG